MPKTRAKTKSKRSKTISRRISSGPRGDLPQKLETQWSKIFDAVYDESGDRPHSARIAWYQIEQEWTKDKSGKWVLKKSKTRTSKSKTRSKKSTTKIRKNCGW